MPSFATSIWSSQPFPTPLHDLLVRAALPDEIVPAALANASNLAGASRDPALLNACHIALGQPDPLDIIESASLKWVHLTSAGYTRYDTPEIRSAISSRGIIITNSSQVYDEPCAQHALAMLLAMARRLPEAAHDQSRAAWNYASLRARSTLLKRQRVLIVGLGTIGKRLVELLEPFKLEVIGFRRTPRGDERVPCHAIDQLDRFLPSADIVINILPASNSTKDFFSADRLAKFKPGSLYLNIGRGDTNDQVALASAVKSGHIAQAYLDVTVPEPLPTDHVLWTTPNIHITPHTAGGFDGELARLLEHFLDNLARYRTGLPLLDQILQSEAAAQSL